MRLFALAPLCRSMVSCMILFVLCTSWLPAQSVPACGDPTQQMQQTALPSVSGSGRCLPGITGPNNFINALVLFLEFPDDDDNSTGQPWPKFPLPQGPEPMMSNIIDKAVNQSSGKKYNITTYFHDQSFGKLTIIGHPYWHITRYSLAQYRQPITLAAAVAAGHPEDAGADFSGNVRYWAVKHMIERLDSAGVDFSAFDRWIYNGDYLHAPGSDSYVDLMFVFWRSDGSFLTPQLDAQGKPKTDPVTGDTIKTRIRDKSFGSFEGIAELAALDQNLNTSNGLYLPSKIGVNRFLGVPQRFVTMYDYPSTANPAPGSGVTILNAKLYPYDFDVPVHEVGHKLGLDHQQKGGVWTLMGHRSANVSSSMNALERWYMHWIDLYNLSQDTALVDTLVTLRDFATTGEAYQVWAAGSGPRFIFENHRSIPSSYITSLPQPGEPGYDPNDLYSYDVVDRTPGQSKGLYILREFGGEVVPVCADGLWSWSQLGCPSGVTPAPWNSSQMLPIAVRGALGRMFGSFDREYNGSWTNCSGTTFSQSIIAYVNPNHGGVVIGDRAKIYGDGKDRWILGGDCVFSPWSNPSTRTFEPTGTTTKFATEIVGETDSTVNVKFYFKNAIQCSPSRPQSLQVDSYAKIGIGGPPTLDRTYKFRLKWEPNIEPDVRYYNIDWGVKVSGSVNWQFLSSTDSMENQFIWQLPDVWTISQPTVCYFRVCAVDSQGKKSAWSEVDTMSLYVGGLMKPALTELDSKSGFVIEPNPASGAFAISYDVPEEESVKILLVDLLGMPVTTLFEGEQPQGRYSLRCSVSGLAQGMYRCVINQGGHVVSNPLIIAK